MLRNTSATSILLAATLSLSGTIAFAQEPAAPVATPNLPAIVVTTAKTRDLTDRIVATGTVKAEEEVYVQPQVEGLLTKTLEADVGDQVAKDAVVARLNDDSLLLEKSQLIANKAKAEAGLAQYRAQLIEAEASAKDAQRQFERATRLSTTGTVSTSQLEQAETTLASANAKAETARQAITVAQADVTVVESRINDIDLKLARTDVKSPVAGTIAARNARIGAIASGAGEPLFTVIRDGQIELIADVSENEILRLKPGQKALITVGGSAEKLTGSVRLVSPVIDAQTRLGAVHIAIDDDSAARSGMYGTADIIINEAEGIALPLSAITTAKGETTTRIVEDGVVKLVRIETGIQDGAYIQVVKGLKEGDRVVAKAGAFVRDGDRIKPVDDSTVSN
ncbi:efflux transporter, RND family, MFP subunit [Rhizobium sp. PDO1-076]|uniref:efflux RND transporter periplasmic adaptor subunit n=1 Tax=Rhizobium sp. PDO1-076 TaxID=1125979 RepID=UPI00024E29CA|nr:efflux RND transporter periplasmic adaptor subunit [Rhizobium sp. PDO1-076]EHS49934.1 efflux transporter, RND family, MFP subunit [Rhizobium sp. PDO1-076]